MPEMLRSLPIRLTTLSPLHIGSGERLGGLDFVWEGRTLTVIDRTKLTARLATNQELAEAYVRLCETDRPRLDEFLRMHRIPSKDLSAYSLPAEGQRASTIFSFIKGANGRPFVPGSSVKGAVRSALLRDTVMRDEGLRDAVTNAADAESRKLEGRIRPGRPARLGHSSAIADRGCFGPDQHHDVLRVLGFADSDAVGFSELVLGEVRVLSVRGASLETKRTQSGRGMILPCEVLAPDREVMLRLTRLDYLLADEKAVRELGFATRAGLVNDWLNRCNQVARWAAERELEFFRHYSTPRLAQWYEQSLLPTINSVRENESVLHFAWGAGFEAMTVTNLLPAERSRTIRTRLALGKGDPFPKSRKMVFRNGEPWMPLGWVLLTCGEDKAPAEGRSLPGPPSAETSDQGSSGGSSEKGVGGSLENLWERFGRQVSESKSSPKGLKGSERAKAEQERIRRRFLGEEGSE